MNTPDEIRRLMTEGEIKLLLEREVMALSSLKAQCPFCKETDVREHARLKTTFCTGCSTSQAILTLLDVILEMHEALTELRGAVMCESEELDLGRSQEALATSAGFAALARELKTNNQTTEGKTP